MKPLIRPMAPELYGIEAAYREHALKGEIQQVITLILLWIFPFLSFPYIDYLIYGSDGLNFTMLAVRISYFCLCLLTIYILCKRTHRYQTLDIIVAIWSACAVGWNILVNMTIPTENQINMMIALVGVFSFYVFIPNRFFIRVIPPVTLSLFTLGIMAFNDPDGLHSPAAVSTVLSFAITNIVGIVFSQRMYVARRDEFLVHREEGRIRAELQRLASTDPLTGVMNRRSLLEMAGEAFFRYRRYSRPFTILVMDLDGFKNVNDTLGHQKGDVMLIEFALAVVKEKRITDALGRMGGDEFCLVLPETLPAEASALAERILTNCKNISAADDKQEVSVTVSIGVSDARPDDPNLDAIFTRADKALYAAKHGGRNRWEIF